MVVNNETAGASVVSGPVNIKKKRKKRSTYWKSNMQLNIMVILPFISLIMFKYIPLFGLTIAFKDYKYARGIFGSEWCGLDNFEMFLTSMEFTRITWNTIYMNFLFIFLGMLAAISLAVVLFQVKSKLATKIFQTTLITPHFISWVIVSYMVFSLLSPQYGLVNTLLERFGRESVDWYTTPSVWPLILIVANIWKHFGMDCIIYYATLIGIDPTLYEAAEIDGAKKWDQVRYIMIPSLVPLITILCIMKIGGIFNADFGLFYQLPRNVGALYEKTEVIDTYIYRIMREVGNMGVSSAAGFLQSLVGLVMVCTTNAVVRFIDEERSLF